MWAVTKWSGSDDAIICERSFSETGTLQVGAAWRCLHRNAEGICSRLAMAFEVVSQQKFNRALAERTMHQGVGNGPRKPTTCEYLGINWGSLVVLPLQGFPIHEIVLLRRIGNLRLLVVWLWPRADIRCRLVGD